MRKLLTVTGTVLFGSALLGWATLGTAEPQIEVPKPSNTVPVADLVLPPIAPEESKKIPEPLGLPGLTIPPVDVPLTPVVRPPMPVGTPSVIPPVPVKPLPPSITAPKETPSLSIPMSLPMVDAPKQVLPKPIPEAPMEIGKPLPLPKTSPAREVGKSLDLPKTETPAEEKPSATSTTPNPTGRQEPSIVLEWIGPATAKVGQPTEYSIAVKNTCAIPVQKVIVQVRVPANVNMLSTEPKAEGAENVLLWEVGTMMPRQDKVLKMKFLPPGKGEVACQAWVTFTGSSVMKMMVREPKLLVKARAPEKVMVGDPANIVLEVSNPGDHPAEGVKMHATLGEGLESARGNKVSFDLGVLEAGQTRTVSIPCGAKIGGEQKCDIYVEADGGLKATDLVSVNVIQPKLDLEVNGPKMRYLNRKAVYTFRITNPGEAPATNVFITEVVPAGFKFVSADGLGQHDFATSTVKWFLPEVAPGQTKEVKVELMADKVGDHNHKVVVNAARGMKIEKEMPTKVEGLSAVSMEVKATDNPVEVGADTTYEIVVSNSGSTPETELKLVCTLPPEVKLKNVVAPVKYNIVGTEMVFEPLPKLAPRADVIYKVTVTATQKGDARFKTQISTASMVEPTVKVEATRIYAD